MTARAKVVADCYVDSVRLLEATRAMLEAPGVDWAWALMATPANLEVLLDEGVTEGLDGAAANDLVLAIKGTDEHLPAALLRAWAVLFEDSGSTGTGAPPAGTRPTDLDEALVFAPEANVAIVSVPGPYAALEAHKALTRGLDVLLFSDNVPLADEVDLKRRACSLGRLVMGPGAGTAALGGVGLGFSQPGSAGAGGSGRGRWHRRPGGHDPARPLGIGCHACDRRGGRDLSEDVGGLMVEAAVEAFDRHDGTELILLVSKPPAPAVAERLLAKATNKPIVAALIGLDRPVAAAPGVAVCNTLEQGVVESLDRLGHTGADPIGTIDAETAPALHLARPASETDGGPVQRGHPGLRGDDRRQPPHRRGVLQHAARSRVGAARPTRRPRVPGPGRGGVHGGTPHPMIDPEARLERLRDQVSDPTVAAVLLDVVIGDGAHPDPAAMLAPAAAEIVASGAAVVVYVLGTERDPQDFERQRSIVREAGCVVAETNARAALAAAALVNRDPALVHHDLSTSLTA